MKRDPTAVAIIDELRQAADVMRRLEDWAWLSPIYAPLADAYMLVGDRVHADSAYSAALDVARQRGIARSVVFAHLCRGRSLIKQGLFAEAEGALMLALAASDSGEIDEFRALIGLSLGEVYDAMQQALQAEFYFRQVALSPPNTPPTYRETYARRQAQEWLSRRELGTSLWIVVLAVLLALSLAFNPYQYLQRRRARTTEPTEPTNCSAPLILDS